MLGRAIFGNPWLFSYASVLQNTRIEKRLEVMVEHTKLYEELLPHKSFAIMKKHFKAYVAGFNGAADLRGKLMEAADAAVVEIIVSDFCATL